MKNGRVITSALLVMFVVGSASAGIVSHNGTGGSNPPGSSEVNVDVNNVLPPGPGLGVSLLYNETVSWTVHYAYEPGEPPVAVELFFDENLTTDTWYALRVDLMGADFVFIGGMPVPAVNPVDAGVEFTQPVACSSIVRVGGNASLVAYMSADDGLLPGDAATFSFFASGGTNGFTMRVTPVAVFSDSDNDGMPDACDASGGPVGACCDACAGTCQENTSQNGCPTPFTWTRGAACADACPQTPMNCDDGLFCTGVESCVAGACMSPGDPCMAPLMCDEGTDACVECFQASDCDDALFCNGQEMCDSQGMCRPGTAPCGENACDEANNECAGPGSATLCASLGDNHCPQVLDRDAYRFFAQAGEHVVVTMEASGSPPGNGAAFLELKDHIAGVYFVRKDKTQLPNRVEATLPATGEYRVRVRELGPYTNGGAFTGDYCLTLEASGDAAGTLESMVWSND